MTTEYKFDFSKLSALDIIEIMQYQNDPAGTLMILAHKMRKFGVDPDGLTMREFGDAAEQMLLEIMRQPGFEPAEDDTLSGFTSIVPMPHGMTWSQR
jgi:hypothetical protein